VSCQATVADHRSSALPIASCGGWPTQATGRSWPLLTHAITVLVDDVDAHFERTERQGAAVLSAPKEQPWGVRRPDCSAQQGQSAKG
jgi:uncharacterized glyoxalase superfamily protein PhnB